jgi:hypothetical protein
MTPSLALPEDEWIIKKDAVKILGVSEYKINRKFKELNHKNSIRHKRWARGNKKLDTLEVNITRYDESDTMYPKSYCKPLEPVLLSYLLKFETDVEGYDSLPGSQNEWKMFYDNRVFRNKNKIDIILKQLGLVILDCVK